MNETTPLLGHVEELQHQTVDHPLVDFDPDYDEENPLDWPDAYKQGLVLLLAFMAFTVTFTCIGVVPVADAIVHDLDPGNEGKAASVLLVTIWELGEAAGPLLIAPLSEIFGRYPIFNAANMVFIIGTILAASSKTTEVLIFARFLTGFAVASNVLNPAIVGDIYASDSRGSAMSLVMLAPLLGGAIGPAISGAIAESLGWRMILWISALIAISCEVVFFLLFRETYKVTILRTKAARLRQETTNMSLKCAFDTAELDTDSPTVGWSALKASITRPMVVYASSPVLQILSTYGALAYTLYYVMATTLPDILRETYGFLPAQVGLSFLAFSIGASGAIFVCKSLLDSIFSKLVEANGGVKHAEFRLPILTLGAALTPAIVAFYGWVPFAQWNVGLLLTCVALLGVLLMFVMVPLAAYVVDAFGLYSASAMTMVLIVRCLTGTLLPLAIPPVVGAIGLGYGFLCLAFVFLVLIPLPVAVMRYGAKWRQSSKYTRNE